jgi:hypothetical protein
MGLGAAINEETQMRGNKQLAGVLCVVLWAASIGLGQQPIVYPAKGQTPEQQQKDIGECNAWATQTTGVDPAVLAQKAASQPAPSGPQGERVAGAAKGAAAGAIIGEIADDDAGKGAATGAVVGVMAGGAKQRRKAQAQQQQQQQAQQQTQQALATYNRAVAACLEGRGYTIK